MTLKSFEVFLICYLLEKSEQLNKAKNQTVTEEHDKYCVPKINPLTPTSIPYMVNFEI